MVEIAESYLWLLLNRGRCFQSLTTPSEAGYTLLCASCDWWEMCVLFFNSLSYLSYLLIKGAWQDRMQLPGLFRERCSLLMCNSTFPCQVHPVHALWLVWRTVCTLAVTGGREINVILKVCQQYKHALLQAKLLNYVALWCSAWHCGSYAHAIRFLAEHLSYRWAVMKDLLCSREDISNYSF